MDGGDEWQWWGASRPQAQNGASLMTQVAFYGIDTVRVRSEEGLLPGRLFAIEGTDGVGRSTQIQHLRTWLESSGYAVLDTGQRRSALAGRGINEAKQGHTLGPLT